tara:strand:- start:5960 stop:7081 length:1122 start_codon:yes stop_codon:yes gene_type:complete
MGNRKMTTARVAVIRGDGIGVDVTDACLAVMAEALRKAGQPPLELHDIGAGAAYYRDHGVDMEPGGEEAAGEADAILLGAIGLPSIRARDGTEISPHLRLRDRYQLYAGVRPIKAYPNAPRRLVDERAANLDLIIIRESTEGLFYSAAVHGRTRFDGDDAVYETLRISRGISERLHRFAFALTQRRQERKGRPGNLTCVDKANVFASMAFFRKIFDEIRPDFPDVSVGYNYVDAMALDLVRKPWEFDVMVTENMFGDILSDLAGGLVGGMGIAPCGEIGDTIGLFQPAHGSAPDIMGQDKANPLAAILSGALMLDYLADKRDIAGLATAAGLIEAAVEDGFTKNLIRPMEFGGDMGTRAVTAQLISLVGNGRS